ncbi:YraN family protein [Clostridium aestuarii]|uniref:UPF0102 protein OW763_06330 n=1 Tax=Clostridium aestuarii TaxID=338193 RepID=A0ABT4D0T4_9CLOT|nr:YraN family protein [Clostridium aestuarii]MCY6483965.1 YraN family protein [Clostridium aestuarii]
MKIFNVSIGSYGENLAENHLKSLGYKIIDRNFTCKIAEIDLIAIDLKTNYISFVEVKSRYSSSYGYPCEAVTTKKIIKIRKAAQLYIMKNKLFNNYNFRFDVIEVFLNHNNNNYSINFIKNAF